MPEPLAPVEFHPVEKRQADALFTALPKEAKWGPITGALMNGQSVFVPNMARASLEVLRSIINYRKYGRLKSRSTEVDGVAGRLLRIIRPGGG